MSAQRGTGLREEALVDFMARVALRRWRRWASDWIFACSAACGVSSLGVLYSQVGSAWFWGWAQALGACILGVLGGAVVWFLLDRDANS